MKFLSLLLIIFWLPSCLRAGSFSDQLCKSNEEVVLSFQVEKDKKTVSICKEKSGKYLVYRLGTKEKIEREFPESLDESSWKKFILYADVLPAIDGKENSYFELVMSSWQNSNNVSEIRNGESTNFSIDVRAFPSQGIEESQPTIFSGNAKSARGSLKQLLAEISGNNRQLPVIRYENMEELVNYRVSKPELVKTKKWKAITLYESSFPKGKEKWEKIHYYEFLPSGKISKDEEMEDEDNFTRGSWRQEYETLRFDAKGRLTEKQHLESRGESDSIFLYSELYGYNDKGQMVTESQKDAEGKITLTHTIRYDARGNDIEYIDHFNKIRWTRTYDIFSRQLTIKEFRNLNELVKIDSSVYTKTDNQIIREHYQKELNKSKILTTSYSKFIADSNGKSLGGISQNDYGENRKKISSSKFIYNNLGLLEQKENISQSDIKKETRTRYFYNANHDIIKEITYSGTKPISGTKWEYVYY